MVFELLYAFFWIALLFFGLRSSFIFKNNTDLNNLTAFGFLIKAVATVFLIIVYEKVAPNSNLFVDSATYIKDTAILNQVFNASPITYFKFLTGLGETNDLVMSHLSETNLWDAGFGLYNDSKNVVRYNSVIYFLSQGNLFVHVVFMSLFSTLGIRLIVVSFKNHIEAYKTLFFVLLFLIPSVFISTGGVLKEPFLILGIGMFLYAILVQNSKTIRGITFVLGLLFLTTIKPYTLLTILLALLFYWFSKRVFPNKPRISLLFFFTVIVLVFFSMDSIRVKTIELISKKQLDMERIAKGGLYVFNQHESPQIMYFKIEDFDKLSIEKDSVKIIAPVKVAINREDPWADFKVVRMSPSSKKWKIYALFPSKAMSSFPTTPIRNSTTAFILAIPEALLNGLLRPFPTDPGSFYKYPAMLEVYFCISMFVFAFFNRKKTTIFEKRILGGLTVFIVATLLLVGFTTPVVGALVRYRLTAFVALIVLSFILFKIPEKWKNRLQ